MRNKMENTYKSLYCDSEELIDCLNSLKKYQIYVKSDIFSWAVYIKEHVLPGTKGEITFYFYSSTKYGWDWGIKYDAKHYTDFIKLYSRKEKFERLFL